MPDSLIPTRASFRFSVPCLEATAGPLGQDPELPERFQLPFLGELEGRKAFADVRAGWNEEGLVFSVRVFGKRAAPWCRDSRIDDSDGLQLNARHDVHCQPSSIKDPTQNIVGVAPEAGGGANYSGM